MKPVTAKAAFKKIKKESVNTLKKKVDAVVSRYVRLSASDEFGEAVCYTCGKKAHYKTLQCGHFVSRNNSATRFDLDNLRVQCAGCNIWGRGRYDVYAEKLMDELGTKKFKELLAKGRSIHSFTIAELKELLETYTQKVEELSGRLGI